MEPGEGTLVLINSHGFGRLGNRLFLAAHLIAFSRRFEVPVLNLAMGDYSALFPWMEGNAGLAYPWAPTGGTKDVRQMVTASRLQELLPWSLRFRCWDGQGFNFDQEDVSRLLKPLQEGRKVYFQGWLFRGYESVQRHRSEILQVFRFPGDIESEAKAFIESLRQRFDRLVGVHVRWEDYRGTEHFLDPSAFHERIESARSLWSDERVGFLLFSNETLDGSDWSGESMVKSPGSSVSADLALMSCCDQLIGPPSTFSAWASFRGGVPLATLSVRQAALRLDDFEVFPG